MRTSLALDALEHAAEPLAARDSSFSSILASIARPGPRNRRREPAAGRCRARRPPACTGPGSGRARRAAATELREMSAHSSTVMVPSGRSAMIWTVVPSRPETVTRTRRKPKSVEHRLDQRRDLGRQAGLTNEARVGCSRRSPSLSPVQAPFRVGRAQPITQNKKSGPEGPTLRVEMIMSEQDGRRNSQVASGKCEFCRTAKGHARPGVPRPGCGGGVPLFVRDLVTRPEET